MNWITGTYTVLIQALQFGVLGYFINVFHKRRVWKHINGIVLFAGMMVVFRSAYLYGLMPLGVPDEGYTLVMVLVMGVSMYWCYEVNLRQICFMLVIYIGICAVGTVLGAASAMQIPYISVEVLKGEAYTIDTVIVVSIMDMWMNLVYVVLVLLYYAFCKGVRLTGKLVYGLILLYQMLIYGLYLKKCMQYHTILVPLSIVLVCMTTLIDSMLIVRVRTQLEYQRTEEKLNLIYEQRNRERQHHGELEEKKAELIRVQREFSEQVKQVWHEVDSYMNKQNLIVWMEEAERQVHECKVVQYCRNPIVNSVVYIKAQKAAELGIKMKVKIVLPEEIGVEAVDLCSIFCNILDNALEACEKVPERDRRYIYLQVQTKAGNIIIMEENSGSETVVRKDGRIVTSKVKPDRHGYGLLLLRDLAEKYEGELIVEARKNVFVTRLMLQI